MSTARPTTVLAVFLAASLVFVACGDGTPEEQPTTPPPDAQPTPQEPPVTDDDDGDDAASPEDQDAVDPAEVGANELGEIPVLMYHRLLDDGGGEYDLTPEEFREELEYLATNDYHPITTAELVSGRIDVPAGTTPVVLTFDDSTREQFALTDDGEVDPDTAVGIMLDVAEQHEGFEATGSFYVLGSLFGVGDEEGAELLRALHDLGFEIGNHSLSHSNLGSLDAAGVQEELAGGARNITDAVPDAEVTTISYPFGVRPGDPALVASGSHDGYDYGHDAGLLVGSGPSPSPFSADFDPLAVPRIRAQPTWDGETADYGSGFWWDVLERAPERRYVSDGDPETISFPEGLDVEVADEFADRANPY